jgi:hypothetical protein
VKQLEAAVARHKLELGARQQEVDQLTTLSLRGDATVQEYMTGLKVGMYGSQHCWPSLW